MDKKKPKEKREKIVKDYCILSTVLGKGCYGECRKSYPLSDKKKQLAVKIIKIKQLEEEAQKKELKLIQREIENLRKLSHPNIVQLIDVACTEKNLYIFLEYCNGGDLQNYLKKKKGRLSIDESLMIFREICSAFQHLYENKIMHRDVKPANILIHNGKIKLCDFGFSKSFDHEDSNYISFRGTPYYASPEILSGQKFTGKCDVFSTGVVLYELIYNKHPFYSEEHIKTSTKLTDILNESELSFPEQKGVSEDIKNILENMLQITESNRYSWPQVFDHSLFQQLESNKKDLLKQILQEKDPLEISLIKSEIYLNSFLVQGELNQEDKELESEIDEGFMESNNLGNRNELVYKGTWDLDRDMILINEYVMFERNIAVLYFEIFRKIWKHLKNEFEKIFFYQLCFLLSKLGLTFLLNVQKMSKSGKFSKISHKQKIYDQFKNTPFFIELQARIKKDIKIQHEVLINLLIKIQKEISESKIINKSEKNFKLFESILNDEFFLIQELRQIFFKCIKQTINQLLQKINELNQEQLQILRLLQISCNPYQYFKFDEINTPHAPNFRDFYEDIKYLDNKQLKTEIKKNL